MAIKNRIESTYNDQSMEMHHSINVSQSVPLPKNATLEQYKDYVNRVGEIQFNPLELVEKIYEDAFGEPFPEEDEESPKPEGEQEIDQV